ncbi:hypothetical protein NC651_014149 [Populus alba x Populus x berolinensis]|nr:hypothetical protein NC651_014149 [Populus alba x Populus x berolinensis]
MKINVALLLLELSYPQSIPFPHSLQQQHHRDRGPSSNPNQTLPKPSSPSQVESNTTLLLLLECLCGALLPTTPVSGTAPPNSLSKPRGVIRNASIEEIEAEKSLIEEDANALLHGDLKEDVYLRPLLSTPILTHRYAQYLVAASGLQDSTPLDTPTELNLKLHKEEGDLLSDPVNYCMLYDESIIRYVHGTTLWGFCSPTGSSLHLVAFNDVDYAGCGDNRCSTMI